MCVNFVLSTKYNESGRFVNDSKKRSQARKSRSSTVPEAGHIAGNAPKFGHKSGRLVNDSKKRSQARKSRSSMVPEAGHIAGNAPKFGQCPVGRIHCVPFR